MTWTVPMTAIPEQVFSAAQWNTYVRDNLLETDRADSVGVPSYFVSRITNQSGLNDIVSVRTAANAQVAASESTGATSYTDLATPGPSVTVVTGTVAIVCVAARIVHNSPTGDTGFASFEVTSDPNGVARDLWSCAHSLNNGPSQSVGRYGHVQILSGLTPGSNTFKMKYRTLTGSLISTFESRIIVVIPL
jgi:hypothetical protein